MLRRSIFAAAALAAGTSAQGLVTSSPTTGVNYAVNVPEDTAKSGSGPIFFQMVAPSGTEWLGLGQGSSMSGANIFMLYSDGNGGVTVSPRLGTGQSQPNYDSSTATSITVLSGSSSNSDGSMTANIRCDGCNSWSGGSMSPTDGSSSWIWAIKTGSPVDSTDLGESLSQHNTMGNINFNLADAAGGSSSNPFIASSVSSSSVGGSVATTPAGSAASTAAASSGSASLTTISQSGTASVTNIVPIATSSGSSSSSSTSTSSTSGGPKDGARAAHGVIMSILFLILFPGFALTLYLPTAKRVRFVHAPLQILSIILLIVGLSTGIILGNSLDQLDKYHQVIGYIIVACLVLLQPALGIYQHLHYHKTGGSSALGTFHQWLGRTVILAGVVNGGLGFMQSGTVGSTYVPRGAVTGYSIVAVVMLIIYVTVVFIAKRRAQNAPIREKPYDRGYEMHPSSHEPPMSPTNPNYQSRNYLNRR